MQMHAAFGRALSNLDRWCFLRGESKGDRVKMSLTIELVVKLRVLGYPMEFLNSDHRLTETDGLLSFAGDRVGPKLHQEPTEIQRSLSIL